MNENNKPRLSVVLATYNRAELIGSTLDCLINQDIDPSIYEIIVIDDGSPDNTREVVAAAAAGSPVRIDYLHHENEGPGFTINRGINAARGELLLLMADDILFEPGALHAHLAMHDAHPEPQVAVLGKVLQSADLTDSVFLQHWDPFGFVDREDAIELPYYMFWACNVSVKRDFMIEHGMFRDERGRAGAAAHEDVEVGYRLSKHGLRIVYSKEAIGQHHHVYTLKQAIRRYYERGLNWGEFWEHAPDPELLVDSRVLNRYTYRDYLKVLRTSNSLRGRERSLIWHLLRHSVRGAIFNRITDSLLWRSIFNLAERNAVIARMMNRRLYAAYLHFHFERGIHDAHANYGQ